MSWYYHWGWFLIGTPAWVLVLTPHVRRWWRSRPRTVTVEHALTYAELAACADPHESDELVEWAKAQCRVRLNRAAGSDARVKWGLWSDDKGRKLVVRGTVTVPRHHHRSTK